MADGYDDDFHGWALAQADALRRRSLNEIDWENLVEEVETLGRSTARELESRLKVLILHLLKWNMQPDMRGPSWEGSIRVQRREIEKLLAENPSLRPRREDALDKAYPIARIEAALETGYPEIDFPFESPFHIDDVLDPDFWPGPPRA